VTDKNKNMKYIYKILFIFTLFISVISCKDDDEDPITVIPENDRTEQQVEDDASLVNYLNTHYYNSTEVNALENPTIDDLVITALEDGESLPTDATLLMSAVEVKSTTYLDIDYNYYILRIRQGEGAVSPMFSDKVRVNYSGFLMDGTDFDRSSTPVVFDLVYVVAGWSRAIPQFNEASSFTTNSDGTVSFDAYGMGVMFLPSGLGYYSASQTSIPSYSNLIFKFELMQTETNDHDFDNIPSYMEDLQDDTNLDLFSTNTDENMFPNFLDQDDDGDGTLTADEIRIELYTGATRAVVQANLEELVLSSNQFLSPIKQNTDDTYSANRITLVDTNGNDIPNYLDSTESDEVN
jgi:FKBP-type peptidyl-prolyl cis-trans isomerase FkpA